MPSFLNRREYWITPEEMNGWLEYCQKSGRVKAQYPIWYFWDNNIPVGLYYFVEDDLVNFALRFKFAGNLCNFYCRKDGSNESKVGTVSGTVAFRIMSQYYKVPHMDPRYCADGECCLTSASLLWYNKKYNNMRNYCYSYDINSAFSYAMLQPMPDTSYAPEWRQIKSGEVGFQEVEHTQGTYLEPKFSGISHFVFPLMDSPFKRFVDVWYDRKQNAKTLNERNKAKSVLNYSIGFLQRVNPFLRAMILWYCNENVKSFIDDNTVYCNTDSIVSLKPRDDLKIGNEIGEWKLEHEGLFAYKDCTYQWGLDKPAYRGVPKSWFPEGYDLLKDPLPYNDNLYEYNPIKNKLMKVKQKWLHQDGKLLNILKEKHSGK